MSGLASRGDMIAQIIYLTDFGTVFFYLAQNGCPVAGIKVRALSKRVFLLKQLPQFLQSFLSPSLRTKDFWPIVRDFWAIFWKRL